MAGVPSAVEEETHIRDGEEANSPIHRFTSQVYTCPPLIPSSLPPFLAPSVSLPFLLPLPPSPPPPPPHPLKEECLTAVSWRDWMSWSTAESGYMATSTTPGSCMSGLAPSLVMTSRGRGEGAEPWAGRDLSQGPLLSPPFTARRQSKEERG